MNFSYINKITSFTNIMTNVKNHKNSKFDKKGLNVCGSCY